MAQNTYQIITDRIVSLLESGTVPWQKPWSSASGFPKNLISGKEYRGVNVWLLHAQRYASPYWLTYKQAKAKGANVRKGEKATPVIFWSTYEKEDSEGESKTFMVCRYYNVFNTDQCDGIEYPEPAVTHTPFEPIAACERIVSGYQNAPRIEYGEPRAYYRPSTDSINMPNRSLFVSPEEFYSTLFHEMTHSTGHKKRLDRSTLVDMVRFGDTNYSKEELVAEMGAAYLCGHAGIENRTIDNSAAYIQSWIRKLKDDPKLLVGAAANAQKASDYILSTRKEENE